MIARRNTTLKPRYWRNQGRLFLVSLCIAVFFAEDPIVGFLNVSVCNIVTGLGASAGGHESLTCKPKPPNEGFRGAGLSDLYPYY